MLLLVASLQFFLFSPFLTVYNSFGSSREALRNCSRLKVKSLGRERFFCKKVFGNYLIIKNSVSWECFSFQQLGCTLALKANGSTPWQKELPCFPVDLFSLSSRGKREKHLSFSAAVDPPPLLFGPLTSLVSCLSTPISSSQPVHSVPSLRSAKLIFSFTTYTSTLSASVLLRCVESIHPHPVGYWAQHSQPLVPWLPSAVQQQLQDIRCPADLYRWDRSAFHCHAWAT